MTRSRLEKTFLRKILSFIYFLKLFLDSLPLLTIDGISSALHKWIEFGQISVSKKIAALGFTLFRKSKVKK